MLSSSSFRRHTGHRMTRQHSSVASHLDDSTNDASTYSGLWSRIDACGAVQQKRVSTSLLDDAFATREWKAVNSNEACIGGSPAKTVSSDDSLSQLSFPREINDRNSSYYANRLAELEQRIAEAERDIEVVLDTLEQHEMRRTRVRSSRSKRKKSSKRSEKPATTSYQTAVSAMFPVKETALRWHEMDDDYTGWKELLNPSFRLGTNGHSFEPAPIADTKDSSDATAITKVEVALEEDVANSDHHNISQGRPFRHLLGRIICRSRPER